MGTKAKCIKCGEEKWINTTKLKNIHDTFGIKPKDWLKNHYICKSCKYRIMLIHESSPVKIQEKINNFAADCKQICNGLYTGSDFQQKYKDVINRLNQKMVSSGVSSFNLIKFKNVIIGIELTIPIIGKLKIDIL